VTSSSSKSNSSESVDLHHGSSQFRQQLSIFRLLSADRSSAIPDLESGSAVFNLNIFRLLSTGDSSTIPDLESGSAIKEGTKTDGPSRGQRT
jgi:hypothetical protein